MANNWKILDGVNYIAKTGASGAAGTMEAPKLLSTTCFVVGKNVIGAGSYIWPAGFVLPYSASLYGDGFVKLLGDTSTSPQSFGSNNIIAGIYFELWAGITLGTASNATCQYNACVFDMLSQATGNLSFGAVSSSWTFTGCIFSNCNTLLNNQSYATYNNCLSINSQLSSGGGGLNNSYLDATSGYQTTSASIVNCNVDPLTSIGTNRGLKVSSGAWGNGQAQAGCTNCITQAPQFNGPARFDFTLNANSPHVTLAIGPAQLGAATSFTLGSSVGSGGTVTTANASIANSIGSSASTLLAITGDGFNTNSQGGWVLVTPSTAGTFVSVFKTGVLTMNQNGPIELTGCNFLGALNCNSDFIATDPFVPVLQNNNVPDYNNGTAAAADRKPNRMSFRMRWSTLQAPDPTIASHWVSGATFVEMEWFAKPTYNASGYLGNADVAFVPANALPIFARTIQLEHTVRNNYGA
jgi:hypothetical protein